MRTTEIVEMPLAEGATLLHPERALLHWVGAAQMQDIGQICYLRRNATSPTRSHHRFELDSLDAGRIRAVRKLIACFSEAQVFASERPVTLSNNVGIFLRFVKWVDEKGLPGVLHDRELTLRAMELYFKHLADRVSRNDLNNNTGAGHSAVSRSILARFFEDDYFGANVRRLRHDSKHTQSTEVPDEISQGLTRAWTQILFDAIARNIIEFGPYPYVVIGPAKDTSESKQIWLYPTLYTNGRKINPFDTTTGEIRLYAELRDETKKAFNIRNEAQSYLNEANKNRVASIRLSHATLAVQCFGSLFIGETAMNLQQMLDLPWAPVLEHNLTKPEVAHQGFRQIKYRAGGKLVSFYVTIGFLPKLRAFLELRKFLLQGTPSTSLFVILNRKGLPDSLPPAFQANLFSRFKTLGIDISGLKAQQLRAAKNDWATRNYGPVTSSKLLGHTLDTGIKKYTNGTEAAHRSEWGGFLDGLGKNQILAPSVAVPDATQNGVGLCSKLYHPIPIAPEVPVKPTCHSTEGCLFCDKYKIHADAIDIRKLISSRYCIRISANRARSIEEYKKYFGAVLDQIDWLLDELKKEDEALVLQIEEDVDVNGNLDRFWSSKLEQLLELGIA